MAPQIRWRSVLPRSDPARLLGPGLDGRMADRQHLNPTTPYAQPEMSDDVLVKVDNVSKRFCRSLKRSLWTAAEQRRCAAAAGRVLGGEGCELP